MGTYNLPRNVKGEGRILFIFTTKSLIYTAIGAGVGLIFYLIFKMMKLGLVGMIPHYDTSSFFYIFAPDFLIKKKGRSLIILPF